MENVILCGQYVAQSGRHSLKPTLTANSGTAAKKLEEWDLKP
jgi:hypothetical protein